MSLEALKRNGHRLELGCFYGRTHNNGTAPEGQGRVPVWEGAARNSSEGRARTRSGRAYNSTEGEYDIPIIQPVQLDKRLSWVRFNHALAIPKEQRSTFGVHFFIDDYLFERAWRGPKRYALFLSDFAAVMSPDFSMFTDYPKAVQVYNHWRKYQLAAYWQSIGIKVIPSVCWAGEASYDWCFDGEPMSGTVAISSVGTQKGKANQQAFLEGFIQMLDRLQPTKLIFVGSVPKECAELAADKHIVLERHSPYYETFTNNLAFNLKER